MALLFRLKNRMNRRMITIVSAVAGVLLLAGVILAVSALSNPDTGDVSSLALTPQEESADFFDQAVAALASGETTEAADLLRLALVSDPDNSAARDELNRIYVATPTPSSSSSPDNNLPGSNPPASNPTEPNTTGFDKPQADMGVLLPTTLIDYQLGERVVMAGEAQVPADPTAGASLGVVRRALFSVHDRETTAAAKEFVTSVSKVAYPKNPQTITVNGVPAYFGTDGEIFAVVAFSRGRYAFEVILSSESGAPSALLNMAVKAAEAFPASL